MEGYSTTLKYSFSFIAVTIWVIFPDRQASLQLYDWCYPDHGCWIELQPCSNLNDCCRYEMILRFIPYVNESGAIFSTNKNFTDEENAWMCKRMTFMT